MFMLRFFFIVDDADDDEQNSVAGFPQSGYDLVIAYCTMLNCSRWN